MSDLSGDLWDIWEKYLETRLIRDANSPEINVLLQEMHAEVLELLTNHK